MEDMPYMDKQGRWMVGNRKATIPELEEYNKTMNRQLAGQQQGLAGTTVKPGLMPVDSLGNIVSSDILMLQQAQAEANRQKRVGANPIGAGWNYLTGR